MHQISYERVQILDIEIVDRDDQIAAGADWFPPHLHPCIAAAQPGQFSGRAFAHPAQQNAPFNRQVQRLAQAADAVASVLRHDRDAQPGVLNPPLCDQIGYDAAHRISRYGESDPLKLTAFGLHGGGNADHQSCRIEQGTARIARMDGGVNLNDRGIIETSRRTGVNELR